MKNNDDLKVWFENTDERIIIDNEKKTKILETLSGEVSKKKIRYVSNWSQIVRSQLYYMDKSSGLIELIVNLALVLIVLILKNYDVSAKDITVFSMVTSSVLGVISILILSNIFTSGMAELFDTCYFNVKQLAGIEMTILGSVNLITFMFITIYVSNQWKIWILQIGVYIGVPFLFTVSICMAVLLTEIGRRKTYFLVIGMLSVTIILALSSVPRLYFASAFIIWCIAFSIGCIFLCIQIKQLFIAINKGEILCIE